jgi:transposase
VYSRRFHFFFFRFGTVLTPFEGRTSAPTSEGVSSPAESNPPTGRRRAPLGFCLAVVVPIPSKCGFTPSGPRPPSDRRARKTCGRHQNYLSGVILPLVRQALRVAPLQRERDTLEQWTRDPSVPPRVRLRARIVLLASQDLTNWSISRKVGTSAATVGTWRRRYALNGLEGIRQQAPRIPRRADRTRSTARRILRVTHDVPPPEGHRWTTRSLGQYLGVSHMQVYRAWKANGFSVEHSGGATRATPPAPWVDVVGLFRCASMRAIVFAVDLAPTTAHRGAGSMDEGDRLRPKPPSLIYVPFPGASELEWSLEGLRELLPGRSVPALEPHDLLIFLHSIERRTPPHVDLHVIVECPDAASRRRFVPWFARRPHITAELTATGAGWRVAVDRFLHEWNGRPIAGASFSGVGNVAEALARFAARTTPGPKAFTWTSIREPPRVPSSGLISSPASNPPHWTAAPLMPLRPGTSPAVRV